MAGGRQKFMEEMAEPVLFPATTFNPARDTAEMYDC